MLTVRFEKDRTDAANEHARMIVFEQTRRHVWSQPLVPNVHQARIPHSCPECGITVWSFVDRYDVRCDVCRIPVLQNDEDYD